MAWSDTTQYRVHRAQPGECGYITFTSTSLTASINTYLSKIYTVLLSYRTSGNSCVFDVPLTASETVSSGAITVTRPSVDGGASTFFYQVIGH